MDNNETEYIEFDFFENYKITNKKTEDEEFNFLENYKIVAGIFLGAILLIYMFSKENLLFSISSAADMGAMGDYFGGMLNPLFSLIGLFALLATIKLQSKALKVSSEELATSSKELELTRIEISKSTIIQKEQSDSLELQNFENTFFKMIDLHSEIMNSLVLKEGNKSMQFTINNRKKNLIFFNKKEVVAKDMICLILNFFQNMTSEYNTYPNFMDLNDFRKEYSASEITKYSNKINQANETNELYLILHDKLQQKFGHYFRNIYQILKFISYSKIENKKFYTNIFRAQFSKDELEFLFYNCVSDIGNEKFLPLLIEFEFLEHLPFHKDINKHDIYFSIQKTRELDSNYPDSKLFGKSTYWKEAITKIKLVHEPL